MHRWITLVPNRATKLLSHRCMVVPSLHPIHVLSRLPLFHVLLTVCVICMAALSGALDMRPSSLITTRHPISESALPILLILFALRARNRSQRDSPQKARRDWYCCQACTCTKPPRQETSNRVCFRVMLRVLIPGSRSCLKPMHISSCQIASWASVASLALQSELPDRNILHDMPLDLGTGLSDKDFAWEAMSHILGEQASPSLRNLRFCPLWLMSAGLEWIW